MYNEGSNASQLAIERQNKDRLGKTRVLLEGIDSFLKTEPANFESEALTSLKHRLSRTALNIDMSLFELEALAQNNQIILNKILTLFIQYEDIKREYLATKNGNTLDHDFVNIFVGSVSSEFAKTWGLNIEKLE
jgi:hypothetical protein